MIKYVSWDLQGTVSDAEFSDTFWLKTLPGLYAAFHHCNIDEATRRLRDTFSRTGKYDIRYYDDAFWANELGFDVDAVLARARVQPRLDPDFTKYIEQHQLPSVILSTTTTRFITYELGAARRLFARTYSCVDDFGVGGKTKDVFLRVARDLGVEPNEIVHIGDNVEMDVENAKKAGVKAIHHEGDTRATLDALKRLVAEEV